MPVSKHITKSKSCEEIINQHDAQNLNENNELIETSSQIESSIDERWYNRFAKTNRQKLILQQQAIDEKVRLNRVQKQLEDSLKHRNQSSERFLTRISTMFKRPTTLATSLVTESSNSTITIENDYRNPSEGSLTRPEYQNEENVDLNQTQVAIISNKRPNQYQQQMKLYDINEDIQGSGENEDLTTREGGKEMILIAEKLTSSKIPIFFTIHN